MSAEDLDTSRTAVKTYVPSYQKSEWKRHAEQLDMSQSEFVRAMVQAGRRDFDPDIERDDSEPESDTSESDDPPDQMAARVETILAEEGQLSWDELIAALTDDVERRLEDALDRLQRENRVQYDGRNGGYTLLEDDGE